MYMLIINQIKINLITYLINKYTKTSATECNILNILLTILLILIIIILRARRVTKFRVKDILFFKKIKN
jgi:hypothetical protein